MSALSTSARALTAVSGFGTECGSLGSATARTASFLPSPRRSRKRKNMRSADSVRDRLRLPTPCARRDARKARTSRAAESIEVRERRQPVQMAGEEAQELGDVAGIGLRRVRRKLALDLEIGKPSLHRPLEVWRGDDHGFSFGCLGQRASPIPTQGGAPLRYYGIELTS